MSRRGSRAAGRARPALLVAAALSVPGLLAVATADSAAGQLSGAGAGPVSSGAHRAAAGFTDLEYSVPFYGILFTNSDISPEHNRANSPDAEASNTTMHFAEVAVAERAGGDLDLSFAVEGQPEAARYQACRGAHGCRNVEVGVSPEGLLYLHVPWDNIGSQWSHLAGFARQPVELSASDADSGLKVYREVMVGPPPAAAGCEDYPDDTPERFTCLFLRELLPPGQAASADVATLRAGLPALVQDSANYRLVFAEEFNGVPPPGATTCPDKRDGDRSYPNGLSTLDDAVWNYHTACLSVDSRGEPCTNVTGGALVMGTAHPCESALIGRTGSAKLNSYGKLHFKYGYVEFKYSFDVDRWPAYYNQSLILATKLSLKHLRNQYEVVVEDWEDLLKNQEIEIDLVEIDGVQDVAHQYGNWDFYDAHDDLKPIRTYKFNAYCHYNYYSITQRLPFSACRRTETITVTRGLEWTPRGYRTYIKVDGVHDALTLVPKDKIRVQQERVRNSNRLGKIWLSGAAKDRYFEYLDPDDPGTLLEQVAVAHVPDSIAMSAWGWLSASHHYIRTRMKIDYIRLWRPENLYTDMEPVYQ